MLLLKCRNFSLRAVRISEDEASLASLENDYRAVMKQNASLIAVFDEPGPNPKLMGAHLKAVISKDESTEPPPKVRKIYELLDNNSVTY